MEISPPIAEINANIINNTNAEAIFVEIPRIPAAFETTASGIRIEVIDAGNVAEIHNARITLMVVTTGCFSNIRKTVSKLLPLIKIKNNETIIKKIAKINAVFITDFANKIPNFLKKFDFFIFYDDGCALLFFGKAVLNLLLEVQHLILSMVSR